MFVYYKECMKDSIVPGFQAKGVSRVPRFIRVTYSTQNLRFADMCNLLTIRSDRRWDLFFL